jgi:hypothetical protein
MPRRLSKKITGQVAGERLELGICDYQHVQILTLTLFAGSGNSGDVRARMDTVLIALNASATADLDKTSFWRVALFRHFKNNGAGNDQGTDEAQHVVQGRSDDVLVALTMFIVLEWSQEYGIKWIMIYQWIWCYYRLSRCGLQT